MSHIAVSSSDSIKFNSSVNFASMFNESGFKTENSKLLDILTASISQSSTSTTARYNFNSNEYDNLMGPFEYEYEDAFNSGNFASNFSFMANMSDSDSAKYDYNLLQSTIVHFIAIILLYGFAMFFLTMAAIYAHRRKIGYNYDETDSEQDQRKKNLFRKLIKNMENCNHYENLFRKNDEDFADLRDRDGNSNLKLKMRIISTFIKILKKRGHDNSSNRMRYNRLVCKNEQVFNESNSLLDENINNKTSARNVFSYYNDDSEINKDNQSSMSNVNRMEPLLCGRGFVENDV